MLRRLVDRFLSIGAYPDESETQRARRRIMVAAIWLATLLTLPSVATDFASGYFWGATGNVAVLVVTAGVLVKLHVRPRWFAVLVNVLLATVFAVQLVQTTLYGGLLDSGVVVLFGLIVVLAALLALGVRAASWWFAAYVASVVYAVLIPRWVEGVRTVP